MRHYVQRSLPTQELQFGVMMKHGPQKLLPEESVSRAKLVAH
jgi:hypothetical protein